LNHWYELIQFANKLIDLEKPWEKLKNEETKNEGIFILKTLLYLIRQLAILSSPILIESFEKIIQILGEENLQKIDTTNKIKNIKEIFDINKFTFKLNPGYLYKKV
jgi:methionyl-tRNA synthetase